VEYETPDNPEIVVDTAMSTPASTGEVIKDWVMERFNDKEVI